MTHSEKLAGLRLRLGIADYAQDALLSEYLRDADAMIRSLSWRKTIIPELENAQVRLAAVLYARRGAEGETSHQEGDVTRVMAALPEDIRQEIIACRLCRT